MIEAKQTPNTTSLNADTILGALLASANLDEPSERAFVLESFYPDDWTPKPGIDKQRYRLLVSRGDEGTLLPQELHELVDMTEDSSLNTYGWIRRAHAYFAQQQQQES